MFIYDCSDSLFQPRLYQSVVDDVITNVREAFLDESVDEQVLQELKQVISFFHINIQLTRYLEFDGTMDKIRVNRSSTPEELRKCWKCSLFTDERETT